MASVTFAVSEDLIPRIKKFSWVNWSETAREELLKRSEQENILKRLESEDEKEFIKWSVELGAKAKKDRFKRLLAELSPDEREELLK
ncbi:MAG: hypothetical protein V1859_06720 [archaeon]